MYRRLSCLLGVCMLGTALVVSAGASQDKKDKEKPRASLPPGWKKLNLSKDQVAKIYEIQAKYKMELKKLEDQINLLKTQERTDMVKSRLKVRPPEMTVRTNGRSVPRGVAASMQNSNGMTFPSEPLTPMFG